MTVEKIIVRMPNWLGDFIMSIPTLERIRSKYPDSKIVVMCSENFSCLLKNSKSVDTFFFYKKPKSIFSKDTKEIISKLKKERFDLGILLTNSFSSAYLFWKAKIKYRIGYQTHFRSYLLNKKKKLPKDLKKTHLIDIYQELLLCLGINNKKASPKIDLSEETIVSALILLQQRGYVIGKKLLGINPHAAYGPAKCWPKERYLELVRKLLADKDLFVVFVGDNFSSNYIKEIIRDLPARAIDLSGQTDLLTLAGVIKLCSLFLTNDSGPMHLAAALDVPLVAIFGSTSDIRTGPYKSGVVIHKRVSCSPCYKRKCNKDFSCMMKIEVKEVLSIVKELIYA